MSGCSRVLGLGVLWVLGVARYGFRVSGLAQLLVTRLAELCFVELCFVDFAICCHVSRSPDTAEAFPETRGQELSRISDVFRAYGMVICRVGNAETLNLANSIEVLRKDLCPTYLTAEPRSVQISIVNERISEQKTGARLLTKTIFGEFLAIVIA